MDFKDRLLLKILKYIDMKLGNVQDNVIILNSHDPYFTSEDRQFLFETITRLVDEFGAIQIPDSGHEDSYEITANQKEITSLIEWLTRQEQESERNKGNILLIDRHIYTYKNITVDPHKASLVYGNVTIPISPQNIPIKFLILLIQNQGTVVHYKEIARILNVKDYDPDPALTDADFSRDIQAIKRDIKLELAKLGDKKAIQIRDMIQQVKSQGYILR